MPKREMPTIEDVEGFLVKRSGQLNSTRKFHLDSMVRNDYGWIVEGFMARIRQKCKQSRGRCVCRQKCKQFRGRFVFRQECKHVHSHDVHLQRDVHSQEDAHSQEDVYSQQDVHSQEDAHSQ